MIEKVVCLIGRPACGKTAPGEAIEKLGWHRTGMSELIKERMKWDAEFEDIANNIMAKGALLPDALVIEVLEEKLQSLRIFDQKVNVVIDGYPRTEIQARWLDDYLWGICAKLAVVNIDTSKENCFQRNGWRREEDARLPVDMTNVIHVRKDGKDDVFKDRLDFFERHNPGLQNYLHNSSFVSVHLVNGDFPKDGVVRATVECLEGFF